MRTRSFRRLCSSIIRVPFGTSTNWGDTAGASRAVRVGDTVHVSGTVTKGETAAEQTAGCLEIIGDAVRSAGGHGLRDVVLTRIIASDIANDLAEIGAAHKSAFEDAGAPPPANTTFGGSFPRPWIRVGVEATAVVQQAEPAAQSSSPQPVHNTIHRFFHILDGLEPTDGGTGLSTLFAAGGSLHIQKAGLVLSEPEEIDGWVAKMQGMWAGQPTLHTEANIVLEQPEPGLAVSHSTWFAYVGGSLASYGTHADVLEASGDVWRFRRRVVRHLYSSS